ncbi:hypothetical protein QQ045_012779 [Rhodiola kirilowii]
MSLIDHELKLLLRFGRRTKVKVQFQQCLPPTKYYSCFIITNNKQLLRIYEATKGMTMKSNDGRKVKEMHRIRIRRLSLNHRTIKSSSSLVLTVGPKALTFKENASLKRIGDFDYYVPSKTTWLVAFRERYAIGTELCFL